MPMVNIWNVQVWMVNITMHAIVCSILTRPLAPFHIMSCGASGKEPTCQCRRRLNPWIRKMPWRREWLSIPIFLPEEFHEQRSQASYRPCDHKESDTTETVTPPPY